MSLDKAMKNLKFDVRLMEKNMDTGSLTQAELDASLQALPDSASNVDVVNLGPSAEKKTAAEPPQHH